MCSHLLDLGQFINRIMVPTESSVEGNIRKFLFYLRMSLIHEQNLEAVCEGHSREHLSCLANG